jgi:hypothetical protein
MKVTNSSFKTLVMVTVKFRQLLVEIAQKDSFRANTMISMLLTDGEIQPKPNPNLREKLKSQENLREKLKNQENLREKSKSQESPKQRQL